MPRCLSNRLRSRSRRTRQSTLVRRTQILLPTKCVSKGRAQRRRRTTTYRRGRIKGGSESTTAAPTSSSRSRSSRRRRSSRRKSSRPEAAKAAAAKAAAAKAAAAKAEAAKAAAAKAEAAKAAEHYMRELALEQQQQQRASPQGAARTWHFTDGPSLTKEDHKFVVRLKNGLTALSVGDLVTYVNENDDNDIVIAAVVRIDPANNERGVTTVRIRDMVGGSDGDHNVSSIDLELEGV
jgi:nucleoid-associated protein YgaU